MTAGGVTRTYTWDSCSNGIGRLCAASTGSTNVGYSYSPEGWITGRAFNLGGSSYSLGYAYDTMGQLAAVDYPDGNQALYDYVDGAVADVRLNVGGQSSYAASGVTYLPMDMAMTGWTSANGLANSIGYDADLRPTSISVPNVESLAFQYDSDDQIIAITNGMNNAASQTLNYDTDGRLAGVSSGVQTASYNYDADGNRIAQTVNGAATTFSYASASNQLTGTSGGLAASYGYDVNGNTVSVNGSTAYSYGPFGSLVNASGAAFAISAEGQRLSKSFGGNTTYFAPGAGGAMLAEDDAGQWHDNVWLNGRLIGVIANGAVYPVHSDQTGRPIAMTNATDTSIVWQATGLPFDRQVTANTWGDFNIGSPGQYFDAEDNLWHNGYRDYDAATGRFIEPDPIGLRGGVNMYTYVGNNPLTFVDPLGLCCSKAQKVAAQMAAQLDQVAEGATDRAAIAGASAVGLEVVGGGPEDIFADVAAAGSLKLSEALSGLSLTASLTAGAARTYASGGDFRYLGRAALVGTIGQLTHMANNVPDGLGEPVAAVAEKFTDSVVSPLASPCQGGSL